MEYKLGDLVIFKEPLMGAESKEVFKKCDVRRIVATDEKNYFVDNFGGTVKVKHKDLECVTRIYSEAVEGEANEITDNGNTIRPGYYQSAMGDVFDIANAYGLDMPLGTAVKYILRAGKKDKEKEIEDLQKAVRCIERAIELRCDNGKR